MNVSNSAANASGSNQQVHGLSLVARDSFRTVHEAAQAIFGLIHDLLGMRICVLTRIDLAANTLVLLDASDKAGLGVVSGMVFRADEMPCECVVRTGGALREFDLDAHPAFRTLPAHTKMGLRSYIGVPLRRSDGTIWGTLAASDTEMRHTTDDDIEMLTVLARLAMFEFEREEQQQALAAHAEMLAERLAIAHAFDEERLRAVRLETILEAAAAVSHEVNNPLTVLMLRLARLKTRIQEQDAEAMDHVDVALEAADEIVQVMQRLRKVVRPVSTRYSSGARMLDLAASSAPDDDEAAE
jgi:GAF domain-containing protein